MAHRGGGHRGHRAPADRRLPAAGHRAPRQGTAAVRRGRRSSSSWAASSSGSPSSAGGSTGASRSSTLRLVGARPGGIVGGFMAVTAFLSMWVSNTACAAMMVPIAHRRHRPRAAKPHRQRLRSEAGHPRRTHARAQLRDRAAAVRRLRGVDRRHRDHHRLAAQRHRRALHPADLRHRDLVSEWLLVGRPLTLLFLPMAWFIVVRVAFRSRLGPVEGGREHLDAEFRKLGPLTGAEGRC